MYLNIELWVELKICEVRFWPPPGLQQQQQQQQCDHRRRARWCSPDSKRFESEYYVEWLLQLEKICVLEYH